MANNSSLYEQRHRIYEAWKRHNSASKAALELGLHRTTILQWVQRVQHEMNGGQPSRAAQAAANKQTVATVLAHQPEVIFENKIEPAITKAEPLPVAERVTADREAQRNGAEVKELREKYKHSLDQIAQLETQVEALTVIRQNVAPVRIQPDESMQGGQAAALWLASDWHVGATVDPRTVNGLNEFNPDIAERRVKNFFANGLRLVRKERQNIAIDTLVLWLGGDLLENYLRPENLESNSMSPVQEALFAKSLIMGGLDMLKADGGFKRIIIPCSYGNHGRTTEKKQINTGHKNSYEWALYKELERTYANDPVITVQVADGIFNYVDVFGRVLCFSHGDHTKYSSGIGGLSVPLIKSVHRSNATRRAYLHAFGHYHQWMPYAASNGFMVNGSILGINAYALSIGASPEPAVQGFALIDSERGVTIQAPIIVEQEIAETPNRAKVATAERGTSGKTKK